MPDANKTNYIPVKADWDVTRTSIDVWVTNLSETNVAISGWLGTTVKLSSQERAVVRIGRYEQTAPEYALFFVAEQRSSKLKVEIVFNPPVEASKPIIITLYKGFP